MTLWISLFVALGGCYLLLSLVFTYLVQQLPRRPVSEQPDWGQVEDLSLATPDGGRLEVWRITPQGEEKGTVLLVHGWGRNRDRMVKRARMFGGWGYSCVLFSARDHGNSTPKRFMNAVKFAEDIATVLAWLDRKVILYGHSAGSGGAIIATHRNPEAVAALFLEATYAETKVALLNLYRWFNPGFGHLFGPAIIFWMDLFYRGLLDTVSPARLAPDIGVPVMLIHGEQDRRFPVAFARQLLNCFAPGIAELYIAPGAGHSESSETAGYQSAVHDFVERRC